MNGFVYFSEHCRNMLGCVCRDIASPNIVPLCIFFYIPDFIEHSAFPECKPSKSAMSMGNVDGSSVGIEEAAMSSLGRCIGSITCAGLFDIELLACESLIDVVLTS